MHRLSLFLICLALPLAAQEMPMSSSPTTTAAIQPAWMNSSAAKLETELVAKYGEAQRPRAQRGLHQVAEFWRTDDGDAAAFEDFVRTNFAGDQVTLDTMFNRFQSLLEALGGHMHEINREFRQQLDLDYGPVLPFDEVFGGYDPSAHVIDDFFNNKLAFTVLLNFPLATLDDCLKNGPAWSRRQWAEVRLAQQFDKRIPADVNLAISEAGSEAGQYISQYNIWMYHVVNDQGQRMFPPKMRLLSHWNLRDEIKADYADPQNGPAPSSAPFSRSWSASSPRPFRRWSSTTRTWIGIPLRNEVKPAAAKDADSTKTIANLSNAREPDTRYAMLWKTYAASRKADPYSPTAPTLIDRRFNEDREIPEARVKAMLEQVLSSPLVAQTGKLIESRLGRPLEPFDVWYNGFRPGSKFTEAQLDEMVAKKYPTAEAYQKDIPNLLMHLGFSPEKAQYVANNIIVDPARGSGHAMGAEMRSEKAHLRTRVEKTGMNYKAFNIAVHEMGHNVEQTFSLNEVDYTLLQRRAQHGVYRGLGIRLPGTRSRTARPARAGCQSASRKDSQRFLGHLRNRRRRAGRYGRLALDVRPSPSHAHELNEATVQIAKDIWNRYYAPVFHQKDVVLLGVYSHMIDSFLYLPDYPIGHMIAFQIEEQMKKAGAIGPEFERMAKDGPRHSRSVDGKRHRPSGRARSSIGSNQERPGRGGVNAGGM